MKKDKVNKLELWIAIILIVLVLVIIILQILISLNRQLNSLETSLFSILQFIFSLAFAWVLARISFRAEFVRSQKQFAIAAFRRIKEIDMTVERVLNRVTSQMKTADTATHKELDVILEISRGIRQSIKSSIADWSDIIGEEIATIEKIEILTLQEEIISDKIKNDVLPSSEESQKTLEKLLEKQDEVVKLLSTLPPALQLETKKSVSNTALEKLTKDFEKQLVEKKYITLEGFWDKTFQKDILDLKVGNKLTVHQGDVGSRVGTMIAYDADGNSVGVIINNSRSGMNYSEYFDALIHTINKSKFEVEILEIEDRKQVKGRHYFNVKTL